jgi:hypothetical protein
MEGRQAEKRLAAFQNIADPTQNCSPRIAFKPLVDCGARHEGGYDTFLIKKADIVK